MRTLFLSLSQSLLVATLSIGTIAHAAKKTAVSKAEVWATWPSTAREKFIAHKMCGDVKNLSEWKNGKKREFKEACVNVVVEQECGCRQFETSYRKYKGSKTFAHSGVSGSETVDCPKPKELSDACKEEVAKLKEDQEKWAYEDKRLAWCNNDTSVKAMSLEARGIWLRYCPMDMEKGDAKAMCERCEFRLPCYEKGDMENWNRHIAWCTKTHGVATKVIEKIP